MLTMVLDAFLICFCFSAVRDLFRLMEPGKGYRYRQSRDEKLLVLTFDDGPHSVYTKKLLDGLKQRGVKASFFLVGENIPGNEALVKQMAEDGHLIGTHCYSHVDLTKRTTEAACAEIVKTNEMIKAITAARPSISGRHMEYGMMNWRNASG